MKIYRINALLLKYYYITMAKLDRQFDIFFWPIIMLLIWGFTSKYVITLSGNNTILSIFLGGVILWTFFQRSVNDVSIYFLEDFWSRNIKNLFTTPIKESELVIATSIFAVIKSFLSFIFLFLIAFFGYKFNLFDTGILKVTLFIIPLLIAGWAIGLMIAAFVFLYGQRISIFAWAFSFLLQPIGAVFYPVTILPNILQKISFFTPIMHIFEGFRGTFNNAFSLYHLSWAFGLAIVYLILGYYLLGRAINKSRKSGFLTTN